MRSPFMCIRNVCVFEVYVIAQIRNDSVRRPPVSAKGSKLICMAAVPQTL